MTNNSTVRTAASFSFISWGGGLQSTCMAVMSALGDLPKVDAAIHVDPGFESQDNYKSIAWYTSWLNDHGLFSQTITSIHNVKTDYLKEHINLPYWTESGAPLRRQCTSEYKLIPAKRRYREIAGFHPTKPPHPPLNQFEIWIGFTLDEKERRSLSRVKYMVNRWPLIELGLTRQHCIDYLTAKGLPIPPKSACVICPYRTPAEWMTIRDQCPSDWLDAVSIDHKIRNSKPLENSTYDKIYLYKKTIPLDQADLEADAIEYDARQKEKAHQIIICDGGSCWT